MKKILSGIAAVMLLVTAVGCGKSSESSKKVEVSDSEKIGKSGTLVVSSLEDLNFDRNSNGIVTAAEIGEDIPDFVLYNYGKGFSGIEDEKELEGKAYGIIVPIKFGKDEYNAYVTFDANQELIEWHVTYDTGNDTSEDKVLKYYEATSKLVDKVYGKRILDSEKKHIEGKYYSYTTTWNDGNYIVSNTLHLLLNDLYQSSYGVIQYSNAAYFDK